MSWCGYLWLYLNLRLLGFLDLYVVYPSLDLGRFWFCSSKPSSLVLSCSLGIQSIPDPHQCPKSGETDTISLGQPSGEPECHTHTLFLFLPPKREAFVYTPSPSLCSLPISIQLSLGFCSPEVLQILSCILAFS